MQLNLSFLLESIFREDLWKPGESVSFSFNGWNLTLKREPETYHPFIFALSVNKEGTNETWNRRYTSTEKALLHVLNRFNENSDIPNKYQSIYDIIELKKGVLL